jgi:hypothetical protein
MCKCEINRREARVIMVFNTTLKNISVIKWKDGDANTAWVLARLCKLQKGRTRLATASDKVLVKCLLALL